jgi:hypothetical protein
MDSSTFTNDIKNKGIYSQCGENKWTGSDAEKLLFTNEASSEWYKGITHYDFANGK